MKLIVMLATIILTTFCFNFRALCTVDESLPDEICAFMNAQKYLWQPDCSDLTEQKTGARYVDLNSDATNELIIIYKGASCGSFYWVFELDKKMKWKNIGSWCGCEWYDENPPSFKVKNTKHNGYRDIWTCGMSGFFDGIKYVGRRQ